jgi:hypothetical protein
MVGADLCVRPVYFMQSVKVFDKLHNFVTLRSPTLIYGGNDDYRQKTEYRSAAGRDEGGCWLKTRKSSHATTQRRDVRQNMS